MNKEDRDFASRIAHAVRQQPYAELRDHAGNVTTGPQRMAEYIKWLEDNCLLQELNAKRSRKAFIWVTLVFTLALCAIVFYT